MTMTQQVKRVFLFLATGLLGFLIWLPTSTAVAEEAALSSGDAKRVQRSSARSEQRSRASASRSSAGRQSASRTRFTATRPRSSSQGRSPSASSSSPRHIERSTNYNRGHSGRSHGSYGYGYGYRHHSHGYYGGHSYYYPSYGYFGFYRIPLYFGYGYGYDGYGYGYDGYGYRGYGPGRGYGYSRGSGDEWGALDLDVSPEKARIYVDGQRIGVADNFDGFPGYLWLEAGTYDVVIYKEGYETISRQYTVYPGVVIDVEDRMVPGEAVLPEDLMAKSSARRDARLKQDRERAAQARLRERADLMDARGEPGRLALEVEPGDASVYLDGRFLGTAEELSRLHSGLIIDAGDHSLQIVRPGYEDKTVEFEVDSGEQYDLEVELDES